ncbi:MAG TPA: TauD/TfdA family dioxygenase [Gammaproteobacteria bacterium]|nr:TauD/TfdA family dioxygenase [Gammaproteobacteria bacterium]
MTYRHIEVRPLTVNIGAEIHGVDLGEQLSDDTFEEIHQAFLEHQVIFFRDQEMSRDRHVELGRRFGELHVHPAAPSPEGYPEILRIHADENSTADYKEVKKGKRIVAGNGWHSDVSCDERPPLGSILYLRQVPEVGGDTCFASMYAAYDALSDTMKAFLSELTAVHSGEHVYRGRYQEGEGKQAKSYPETEHPVVRTHPETGRPALFVNRGFTTHIVGIERAASNAILGFLYEHMQRNDFTCRFKWEPNSVAFWDNRCVQHSAVFDYYPAVRSGERVTVQGDRPSYRPQSGEHRVRLAASRG